MNDYLVSIVVPVYNSSRFIVRCINSVLVQSYKNIELIIVDDGSTDNSLEICNSYSSNKKIRIVTQTNKGASAARNNGAKLANGAFLTFLDSDDILHSQMIETLLELAIKSSSKFVVGSYQKFYGNYEKSVISLRTNILSSEEYLLMVIEDDILVAPWGKLYHADIYKNINFDVNMRFAEDMKFLREILIMSPSISVTNYKGYYYSQESLSLVRSNYNISKLDRISEIGYWKNSNEFPFVQHKEALLVYYVKALIDDYSNVIRWKDKESSRIIQWIENEVIVNIDDLIVSQKLSRKYRLKAYLIKNRYIKIYKFLAFRPFKLKWKK